MCLIPENHGFSKCDSHKQLKIGEILYTYGLISNTPPQTVDNPSAVAKCLALIEGNAFVSVSAAMLFVEQ